jgi:hypothetical protein
VYGTINQLWGLATIVPDSIFILNRGNKTFAPIIVQSLGERLESQVVKFEKVHLTRRSGWDTTSRYNKISFFCYVTQNGVDSIGVVIQRYNSAYFMQPPAGNFNISGVVGQIDFSSPYSTGYYIIVRDSNDIEPLPDDIPLLPIGSVKINDASGVDLAAKQSVRCYLHGIVNSGNIRETGLMFSLEDKTGAITVYNSAKGFSYAPVIGDSILVRGFILQKDGQAMIQIDSLLRINSGNRTYKPSVVYNLTEQYESYPVTLQSLKLVDSTQWNNALSQGGFWFDAIDSVYGDTVHVWAAANTDISAMKTPAGYFDLTGVLLQKDLNLPLFSDYYIAPWTSGNFELHKQTAIKNQKGIDAFSAYPNPTRNEVLISSTVTGEIVIYDLNAREIGRMLIQKNMPVSYDFSGLNSGPYLLRFTNKGLVSQQILIKE